MSIIHVRSIPDEVAARLQARAKGHHRSMEAEVRAILADVVQAQPPVSGARHMNFDLIAKMDLGEISFEPMQPSLKAFEL